MGRQRKAIEPATTAAPGPAPAGVALRGRFPALVGNRAVLELLRGERDPAEPLVAAVLRSPGEPLAPAVRALMEARLGCGLDGVRVHRDAAAAESARALRMRAYAAGSHVVFGDGQYCPETAPGQSLLAHEIAHVVQQGRPAPGATPALLGVGARGDALEQEADRVASAVLGSPGQASLAPSLSRTQGVVIQGSPEGEPVSFAHRRVFVIGSPAPAEIQLAHPYQFVRAAVAAGGAEAGCIWLVERTGYEAGGVDLEVVRQMAGRADLRWLGPDDDALAIINALPRASVTALSVFSHGLPGLVALRHGWEERGLPDRGISLEQVKGARPEAFAHGADIQFDSCNTGTADFASPAGNLAQQLAQRTGQDVRAWTGRTSYTEVNASSGPGDVVASEMARHGRPDWKEVGSQLALGRFPERRVFSPVRGPRVDGFRATFEIRARLPRTRSFNVPAGGAVVIRCPDPELIWPENEPGPSPIQLRAPGGGTVVESDTSFQERMRRVSGSFAVVLHREGTLFDDAVETFTFPVEPNDASAVFSKLATGSYYVEIYKTGGQTSLPVRSTIEVDVHAGG